MESYRHADDLGDRYPKVDEDDYGCISIYVGEKDILFVNKSKGGVYRHFREGDLLDEDNGISIEKNGKTYTSNWPGSTDEVSREKDSMTFEGRLREVPRNTMPGMLFMASRLFNYTLGKFPSLSLKVKDVLISRLIGSDDEGPKFKRRINLQDGIEIEDSFEGTEVEGKVRSNFVPSSEFFSKQSLNKEN